MGITKFTSFVVFLFGILLLLVVAATFIMRWMEPAFTSGTAVKTVLPACDLEALNLGTKEQFAQKLDALFESGGIEAVRDYVEKEIVPGRIITISSSVIGELPVSMGIVDREMRRCDDEGAEQLSVGPVLPRISGTPTMGDDVRLSSWSRLHVNQPFKITTWWVQRG